MTYKEFMAEMANKNQHIESLLQAIQQTCTGKTHERVPTAFVVENGQIDDLLVQVGIKVITVTEIPPMKTWLFDDGKIKVIAQLRG